MSAEDHRLIAECLQGDPTAFGGLVRRYQDRLFHVVFRLVGNVEDAQVRASSPEEVFDDAALRAVRQWRYEPPMVNGQPAAQRSAVRLKF